MRQVREEDSYARSVDALGGAKRIDAALTAVMTGISYRPEGFPLVGDTGLRIAKTVPIQFEQGTIPALRVYFEVIDENIVVLWWIEAAPVDDEITF